MPKQLHTDIISRPFVFKIEFTRGCNLACTFCPISILPDYSTDKRFLKPYTMFRVARELSSLHNNPRIELTMRGEPTLNPDFLSNVQILREHMPRAQISLFTNGIVLLRNPTLIRDAINRGVNIFNIDCYNNTYDRFSKLVSDNNLDGNGWFDIEVKDFRTFSAYGRHNNGWKLRVINLVPDIADKDRLVNIREVHNMAGNVNPAVLEGFGLKPVLEPLKKNCARPYREAVVTYDARMLICCHDWKDEGEIGDLTKQTAMDIWYGDKHLAILQSLWNKDRSGPPCYKCDYFGGYRMGLLQKPFRAEAV